MSAIVAVLGSVLVLASQDMKTRLKTVSGALRRAFGDQMAIVREYVDTLPEGLSPMAMSRQYIGNALDYSLARIIFEGEAEGSRAQNDYRFRRLCAILYADRFRAAGEPCTMDGVGNWADVVSAKTDAAPRKAKEPVDPVVALITYVERALAAMDDANRKKAARELSKKLKPTL